MYKVITVLFFFFLWPRHIDAQITPAEGRGLNYRIIGFSFPGMPKANKYSIQIAAGNYKTEDSFQKNITITCDGKTNKIIGEVPFFGREYTWRVIYFLRHSDTVKSELYHFHTLMSPLVDSDSVRLRIINNAVAAHKDDYVFLDGNKVLYDMKGNPVWYLPDIETKTSEPEHPRDLKVSPFGTITLLMADKIYEINYNVDILWKGPGKNSPINIIDSLTNVHHHEFTRLSNGHYMALAYENALWKLPSSVDSSIFSKLQNKIIRDSNNIFYQKIIMGIIVEYDTKGNIVWKWRASDYFKSSDLSKIKPWGLFDMDNTHENAFYFDEDAQTIHISFRDLNQVVKIQYPGGEALGTYGKPYASGITAYTNGLFCGQHSCRLSHEGYLYVFNNNVCHPKRTPTIIMMKESRSEKDSIEKVWEFECPMDDVSEQEKKALIFNTGGNVFELPDDAIFCCMGSDYGKTFIVSRDKQILWCAQPERRNRKENKWQRHAEYRGSIISRKDLECLIWNEPLKN